MKKFARLVVVAAASAAVLAASACSTAVPSNNTWTSSGKLDFRAATGWDVQGGGPVRVDVTASPCPASPLPPDRNPCIRHQEFQMNVTTLEGFSGEAGVYRLQFTKDNDCGWVSPLDYVCGVGWYRGSITTPSGATHNVDLVTVDLVTVDTADGVCPGLSTSIFFSADHGDPYSLQVCGPQLANRLSMWTESEEYP